MWLICGSISSGGRARNSRSTWVLTPLLPLSMRGLSFGNSTLTGWGRALPTGREETAFVKYARASWRWAASFEESTDKWWENCADWVGAVVVSDCFARTMDLDLKLVSVKLSGLGRALPTFSLGFLKSLAFSFFFLELDPIAVQGGRCRGPFGWGSSVDLGRKLE